MTISEDILKDYEPDPAQMAPIIRELHMQNDRGAAIIAGVFLSDKLQEAIIEQWPPISATNRDKLFGGYGPLGSFSARIDIAAAMGVLNTHSKADFHKMRQIRNMAAHAGEPFSFDGERETVLISKIECMKHMPSDEEATASIARNLFTGAAKILSTYLFFQAHFKRRFGHLMVMPDYGHQARQSQALESSSTSKQE